MYLKIQAHDAVNNESMLENSNLQSTCTCTEECAETVYFLQATRKARKVNEDAVY